jgi:uncharacterized protein (TIGR02231 family)
MAQLNTSVTAVVVYLDRARVTRAGKVALEPGVQRLEVPELPLKLNPESLRAAARGTARVRLLDVQVQRVFSVTSTIEQIRELESQIEALQDELRALDARTEMLKQNRMALAELAGRNRQYARALASGTLSLEAHLAMLDGLTERVKTLDDESRAIDRQKRDLERQVQKLVQELDNWRGVPRQETYTAWIDLEVIQAGDLTVELAYVVFGAGWQPLYDLRLLQDEKKPVLDLHFLAQVTQNTGEAWQDVALALSTARPALSGKIPELDPWYIAPLTLPAPAPEPGVRLASIAPMMMKANAARMVEPASEEIEAEVAMTKVDATGAAVTYQVPGSVSVPPDGTPHKLAVAGLSLEPDLDFVTSPKLVEAVYRRLTVTNNSPYTFLPGSASLFVGEEYIGAARLELVAPQGKMELYLGTDDRIKVERKLKRREVDKRLIGGKRLVHYGYEVEIKNLLPTLVKITLRDQIPLGRHEDIKTRLESSLPKPTEQTELNLLTWEFSLASQEKRLVRFDFAVEYPQDMEVIGLS